MTQTPSSDDFSRIVDRHTESARNAFAAHLSTLSGSLDADEAERIGSAVDEALRGNARLKLNRVLLLELHAARRAGTLTADDDAGRFAQFVEQALQPAFDAHLDRRYPPLRERLATALARQRGALEALVTRLVADRAALAALRSGPTGRLIALDLGQGDLHAGGQAVARLTFDDGKVMYKPRSLRIDAVLDAFVARVFNDAADRIRVPAVIDRGDYGWTEFVAHRYCDGADELRTFYRGLGHWLAVLRLLGGTDIHYENLIAVGPVPVVIDVESLFARFIPPAPSAYGDAYDAAQTLVRNSVLRTGIVPYRAPTLGFDGVDVSAAGALPGEQPPANAPIIVNAGTTDARLKIVQFDRAPAQNHPSPKPDVSLYWDEISDGFLAASAALRTLDAAGELDPLLAAFVGCAARDIRRATHAYGEIGRMLWHPASLHDEAAAIERARDLFARNAKVVPIAPSQPHEIAGEIDDLRYGDVPIFGGPLARARVDASLADWRAMRIDLEELTIRSALVATELNRPADEPDPADRFRLFYARAPHADRLDARRRRLAADTVERLLRLAVRGNDGTVTWITPETSHSGWLIQPLQHDIYFGLGGVAVALAGYLREAQAGRADAVNGLADTVDGALAILAALDRHEAARVVGAFNGHGGQIWTWLTLHDVLQRPALLDHAIERAVALERDGFARDRFYDVIDGAAGVIVPLIDLADATGDARWLALAARAAAHLEANAIVDEHGARWPAMVYEEPIGGFAHGATGTAWALARLALSAAGSAADRERWATLAHRAFAFQDSLYDEEIGNWLDKRQWTRGESFHTWCNGSVGIGLAAADLYARTGDVRHRAMLRRAFAASRDTWGASHTLCHGDFSLWEFLVRAADADPEGCAIDRVAATAQVISSVEEHRGVVGSRTRAAFTPGLMTGLAGAVHGFNRLHPDCTLASPLLLERTRFAVAETRPVAARAAYV
jgi:type 2 lantibiotic biosynthesis protein LanM